MCKNEFAFHESTSNRWFLIGSSFITEEITNAIEAD